MSEPKVAVEHGVEEAFYNNIAHQMFGHPCPQLVCLCGFTTEHSNESWQSAGEDMDEHLAEVPK